MSDGKLITIGIALVSAALIPTPDDVTVISPIVQLVAGTVLIVTGVAKK